MKCGTCGYEVEQGAESCPGCGYAPTESSSPPAEATSITEPGETADSSSTPHISETSTRTGRIYGIDLGTTYSCISYVDDHGRPVEIKNSEGDSTTPSVVYFESPTNIVVGKYAKDYASIHEDRVVSTVKRVMGEPWEFECDGKKFGHSIAFACLEQLSKSVCTWLEIPRKSSPALPRRTPRGDSTTPWSPLERTLSSSSELRLGSAWMRLVEEWPTRVLGLVSEPTRSYHETFEIVVVS